MKGESEVPRFEGMKEGIQSLQRQAKVKYIQPQTLQRTTDERNPINPGIPTGHANSKENKRLRRLKRKRQGTENETIGQGYAAAIAMLGAIHVQCPKLEHSPWRHCCRNRTDIDYSSWAYPCESPLEALATCSILPEVVF